MLDFHTVRRKEGRRGKGEEKEVVVVVVVNLFLR